MPEEANPAFNVCTPMFYTDDGKIKSKRAPLPGAVIQIQGRNSGRRFKGTTDKNGSVQIDTQGVSDEWITSVSADGYLESNT